MKRLYSYLVLLATYFATGNLIATELPKPAENFYKKYPVYQKFFPFGLVGGLQNLGWESNNMRYMDHDHGYRFWAEFQRENYINFIWGHITPYLELKDGKYVLDKRGQIRNKWMKELDIYFLPSMQYWFDAKHGKVFKGQKLKNRFLNENEIETIIKNNRTKYEAIPEVRKALGDRMIALAIGDEPISQRLDEISAMQSVKRFIPDLPVTWVTGWKDHTFAFLPYMELICSESYGRHHSYRWNNRDLFLEYYKKSPNTIVWNDILVGSFSIETTLPDFPDERPKQGEVRLAFWQSLAGGAKGFMSYLGRLHPSWRQGDNSFFNQFGKNVKGDNLSVLKEIGRELTAVGPLLLSCNPVENEIKMVKFTTHPLNYPFFKGPALDCGILKDKHNEKLRYVVVYNNNIDKPEKGKMTLPKEWVKSAKVFNLHSLQETKSVNKDAYPVNELKPGEGRVYLISPDSDFNTCKITVLKHRIHNELIRLDILIRDLTPMYEQKCVHHSIKKSLLKNFPEILKQKKNIENELKTATADYEELYKKVLSLYVKTEKERFSGNTGLMNQRFRIVEKSMAELDKTIEAYSYEVLGYPMISNTFYTQAPKNRDLMFEYMNLTSDYFSYKNIYWRGLINPDIFVQMDYNARQAKKLLKQFQDIADKQLNKQRRPINVLFITPEIPDMEFFQMFTWLYRNFPAVYGHVKKDGSITDRKGKKVNIKDFDVVWLHGLQIKKNGNTKSKKAEDILSSEFLQKPFIDALTKHLNNDKSIMLTGIMALLVVPLGLEKTFPNVITDWSSPNPPMLRGFIANPGFEKHPVFDGPNNKAIRVGKDNMQKAAGFSSKYNPIPKAYFPRGKGTELRYSPDGFYTSGHYPGSSLFCECTWKDKKINGRIIADVYDSTFEELDGYAGIIEYGGNGKGKVLVAGAQPFDFTPGNFHNPKFWQHWKYLVRGLTYNMICYLGGKNTFTMDKEAAKKARTKKDIHLLPIQWKFKLDPDNEGMKKEWFKRDLDDKKWSTIKIGSSWESQGHKYDGYAWYRVSFKVPEKYKGKKVFLHFGAVDEVGDVYLDGKYLGQGGAPPEKDQNGWAKPFHFDITDKVKDISKDYQLTVRVHDSLAAGGIWKPVYLSTEP